MDYTDHTTPEDGAEMLEMQSARDRLLFALAGDDQQAVSQRLEQVVDTVAGRLQVALEEDARRWSELATKMRNRTERVWQPLALEAVADIERAGAMVPGLSHQEIYLRELREACGRAETLEDFRTEMDALIATWGSVLKYPLFGSARKRELKGLVDHVESTYRDARAMADATVQTSVATWRQEAHEASRERIRTVMLDMGGLLSSCFEVDLAIEETIRMRWLLISILTKRLFTWLMEAVRTENTRKQDHIYFMVECLLGQIYESFKVFIVAFRRRATEIGSLDTVASLVDLEIRSAQQVTAQFEQRLRVQPLTPALAGRIKELLRSQSFTGPDDTDAFVAVSAGLRGNTRFGDFLAHLKTVPGIDESVADRVAVAVKTAVEPLRSLTYVAITMVRYLKGLQNFKPI
jgi:hypothetical protein